MPRLTNRDEHSIREIRDALRTLSPVTSDPIDHVIPVISRAIGADAVASYGIVPLDDRLSVEFVRSRGGLSDAHDALARFVDSAPVAGWGGFDPCRPQVAQRNLALRFGDLRRRHGPNFGLAHPLLKLLGVDGLDQLRVLVCEGPSLLGWVGGFREGEFTIQSRRILQRLVPDLRVALRRAREVRQHDLMSAAAAVAIEAIGAPAFVVGPQGEVEFSNSAGRAMIAAEPRATRDALANCAKRGEGAGGIEYSPIAGANLPRGYALAVFRTAKIGVDARAYALAAHHGLTPAETRVLVLVACGATNAAIAIALGASVKTIEKHVTRILERLGAEGRAAIVARVWSWS